MCLVVASRFGVDTRSFCTWRGPYVLAMLQTGAAAAWTSAMVECMFQLLSPKLDALGSPRETPARWEEFVKSWPRQWQTLVALFAKKRKGLKENAASADFTGSSGDEFLCPDCGDVFPTLSRLKCHRGKAHKVRRQRLGSCVMACARIAASTFIAGQSPWRIWRRVRRAAGRR